MNVESHVNDFTTHMRAKGKSDSTIEWAEVLLTRFLEWAVGAGIASTDLASTRLMAQYQIYVSTLKTRRGKLYTPEMQNRHLAVVRKFYDYLRVMGEVTVNPTEGLEYARTGKRLPRGILTPEVMLKLIVEPLKPSKYPIIGKRDHVMLTLLYASALRRAELLGLDVGDLQLEQESVFVREGKGWKDRVVPMGVNTTALIVEYLEDVRPKLANDTTGKILFPCAFKGTRLTSHALKYMVDKYTARAGITERVTPHTFRHTAASHILHNADENCLRELQEYLGHENLSTTGVYLHTNIARLRELFTQAHPLERAVA